MQIQKVLTVTFIVYMMMMTMIEVAATNQGILWRHLQISQSLLNSGARQNGSHVLPSATSSWLINTACSLSCQHIEWCSLWCPDPSSSTSCLLFDMYVVPGYNETNLADVLDCYTRTPKDFAVGATIEGTEPQPKILQRNKENLVDGIYGFKNVHECYNTLGQYNQWFKIDLGSEKPIRRIILLLYTEAGVADVTHDVEVRVGIDDVTKDGDFTSFKFFGYFPGPGVINQEIVFSRDEPILARFVSVQRWTPKDPCFESHTPYECRLNICHIEIS